MAEHLRLWIGSKSTTQHNDLKSNFGTFCMEKDLQGDNLDEYSDGLATELKGIGLWGGHHQFKSVMMAYNDYKCADTLVAHVMNDVGYVSTECKTTATMSFARLIAANRSSLIAAEGLTNIPVTESERKTNAITAYRDDPRRFMQYPPNKIFAKLYAASDETDTSKRMKLTHAGWDTLVSKHNCSSNASENPFICKEHYSAHCKICDTEKLNSAYKKCVDS